MSELFSWQTLATMSGAGLATGLITQLLKNKIPIKTQFLSFWIAYALLTASLFFTGCREVGDYALALVNAVIVASAASNTVSLAQRLKEDGKDTAKTKGDE